MDNNNPSKYRPLQRETDVVLISLDHHLDPKQLHNV